jgi:hypothetical protein
VCVCMRACVCVECPFAAKKKKNSAHKQKKLFSFCNLDKMLTSCWLVEDPCTQNLTLTCFFSYSIQPQELGLCEEEVQEKAGEIRGDLQSHPLPWR